MKKLLSSVLTVVILGGLLVLSFLLLWEARGRILVGMGHPTPTTGNCIIMHNGEEVTFTHMHKDNLALDCSSPSTCGKLDGSPEMDCMMKKDTCYCEVIE